MHDLYSFVSGPLVWVSFIIFIGGSMIKLFSMYQLAKQKDSIVFVYFSPKFAFRSIIRWLTPFGTVNMQKQPIMTVVTFVFHICLILVPIFLYAHIILFKESFDISWIYLPDTVADIGTVLVVLCCGYFLYRRVALPEVQYLTSASDFVLLVVVAAPFITGFWTYHQLPGYNFASILHILAGEIMLAAIPFTRLSHMFFFPVTRGYIGSEFGGVRHVNDW